jgi:hypothetical protein
MIINRGKIDRAVSWNDNKPCMRYATHGILHGFPSIKVNPDSALVAHGDLRPGSG